MGPNYTETANTTPYPLNGGAKPNTTNFTTQPNPELFKLTEENNNLRALLERERAEQERLNTIVRIREEQVAQLYALLDTAIKREWPKQ